MLAILVAGLAFALGAIGFAVAAIGTFLGVLTVAAFAVRPRVPTRAGRVRRFGILVPAHDEAEVIGRLLRSLDRQEYPRDRFDIFVVADNCGDATAAIARAHSAIVYERQDDRDRAKGYALRWLLTRVRTHGSYDAYVVFDADSMVSPGFLGAIDARLEGGSRVIQAHYRVLNPSASPLSALRDAAFASLHYVRPLGRAAFGWSCGLKGNGMCFDATLLETDGWSAAGLAEDVEMHLELVRAGVIVEFAPEAVVRADMPTTLRDAATQNQRWEAGRLRVARRDAARLLLSGIAHRRAVEIDAAIEELIPPLSTAVAAGIVVAATEILIGAPLAAVPALYGTGLIFFHVVAGVVAVRAPVRTYLTLAVAPAYIVWKLALWSRALFAPTDLGWRRTPRVATNERSDRRAQRL
jgi:1,2-diacylglycerol 3-beta-glucosyltransferase